MDDTARKGSINRRDRDGATHLWESTLGEHAVESVSKLMMRVRCDDNPRMDVDKGVDRSRPPRV